MASLPAAGYFSQVDGSGQPAITVTEAKQAQDDTLAVIRQIPGGAAIEALTIAGGLISPTLGSGSVSSETGTADNLDNIAVTVLQDGALYMLTAAASHTITVRNNQGSSGKILTVDAASFVMTSTKHWLLLKLNGAQWEEVYRSYGPDAAARRAFIGVADASDTVKGVVELATAGETDLGSDTARAMTPGGFASGWQSSSLPLAGDFPGGLKFKADVSSPGTISFAAPFPSQCFGISLGCLSTVARFSTYSNVSETGFTLSTWTDTGASSTAQAFWFAWGK